MTTHHHHHHHECSGHGISFTANSSTVAAVPGMNLIVFSEKGISCSGHGISFTANSSTEAAVPGMNLIVFSEKVSRRTAYIVRDTAKKKLHQ